MFADLDPTLGPSWAVLGPSWAILGRLGPILGPSWAYLGPLLGQLGSSWGHPGALLGHLCLIWRASWAIFCHLGATFYVYRLSGAILEPFGPYFGPSRDQFWPSLESILTRSAGRNNSSLHAIIISKTRMCFKHVGKLARFRETRIVRNWQELITFAGRNRIPFH